MFVSLLASIDTSVEARCDVIADIGRSSGECGAEAWLERSTVVAVVVRRDAASKLHVPERAACRVPVSRWSRTRSHRNGAVLRPGDRRVHRDASLGRTAR